MPKYKIFQGLVSCISNLLYHSSGLEETNPFEVNRFLPDSEVRVVMLKKPNDDNNGGMAEVCYYTYYFNDDNYLIEGTISIDARSRPTLSVSVEVADYDPNVRIHKVMASWTDWSGNFQSEHVATGYSDEYLSPGATTNIVSSGMNTAYCEWVNIGDPPVVDDELDENGNPYPMLDAHGADQGLAVGTYTIIVEEWNGSDFDDIEDEANYWLWQETFRRSFSERPLPILLSCEDCDKECIPLFRDKDPSSFICFCRDNSPAEDGRNIPDAAMGINRSPVRTTPEGNSRIKGDNGSIEEFKRWDNY